MTSSPVMGSQISALGNYLNQTANTGKTETGDFKSFMNQSKNTLTDDTTVKVVKNDKTVDKANENLDQAKDVDVKDKPSQVSNETEVKDVPQEKVDAVKDAVEEVVEVIKEELEVTEEDIVEALETLGLTMVSLLDTTKLPEIVAYLTDSNDTLSIAMDETLYKNLTNITNKVEETVKVLANELDIPKEELKEAIKTLPKTEIAVDANSVERDIPEELDLLVKDTKPQTFEEKITVNVKDEKKVSVEKIQEVSVEETDTKESKETVKLTTDSKESGKFENRNESKNSEMTFAQTILAKAEQSINETAKAETIYTSVDVEDIMNQITEFIKVDISEKTTEVNLRLHPESLGTVNVKVTANNEGVLTAQFTAQNESVKAIIESQAIVLREALEQKGVSIEAVEVLVQSHEFERNFNDQSKNSDNSGNSGRKAPRRINLAEEVSEELGDEDRIVKEMMAQNGNTIDYSA